MSATTATQANASTASAGPSASAAAARSNPYICRYFFRGFCRYGPRCRFSHDIPGGDSISNTDSVTAEVVNSTSSSMSLCTNGEICAPQQQQPKPSTSTGSQRDWANAPVFVPTARKLGNMRTTDCDIVAAGNVLEEEENAIPGASSKSWADVVGAGVSHVGYISSIAATAEPGSMNMVCPYENPCPYDIYCAYAVHLELCKMCDQYCLHPNDQAQRRKHNQECLQQHEQAMELSFAIARSKDKTCGICFDTIMEKSGREKRFGILPNCSHIFCLECIRKWRQAKQFEHKITRSCPECRVSSDFVCPSAFWVETKDEKDKLLSDYRSALGIKDCKYFKKGEGKCPFGNKCFYKHALPNGELVDVGCPKRARKLHRAGNEIIDLLDIYLWEYVEQRDYHFVELFSSTSDESDSDFSDD